MHTIVLFYTSYKRVSILTTMGMRYIRYACNGGSSARSVPSIVTKRYPCWTEFISKSARHLGETLVSERDRCKKMDILAVYIPWGAYSRVCTTRIYYKQVCESIFKSWQILYLSTRTETHPCSTSRREVHRSDHLKIWVLGTSGSGPSLPSLLSVCTRSASQHPRSTAN